ncbi:MAG: PAS domain S-box protein [Bryobacterales bacterium]|nr:PAS domain S-box protein [Bryobacterales bacterium]
MPVTVLYIDGNESNRRHRARTLRDTGFLVLEAADTSQALTLTQAAPPDIALVAAGPNSFEALRQWKSHFAGARIPVVLISPPAEEIADVAPDGSLREPVDPLVLVAALRALLPNQPGATSHEAVAVLESISEGYVLLDDHFKFRYVNAAAERTVGFTRDIMLGRAVWEAFPEIRDSRIEREFLHAMAERVATGFEHFFEPWKRWFRIRIYPGVPSGIVIYFQDISSQKELEASAASARARLHITQKASGIGTWEWDPQTGEMFGSAEWRELLELGPNDTGLYSAWINRIHPEDRERVLAAHRHCIEHGSSEVEYRSIRPSSGQIIWILRRSSMLVGDAAGPLRMIGVGIDVTARKHAIDESERTLLLLETLTNNAPAGFLFLDSEMRYRFVNTKLAEMNGLPAESHIGLVPEQVVPALAAQARAVFEEVMRTGQPVFDHEFTGETPQAPGQIRSWSESWYPVRTRDGRLLGVGAVIIETTEQKRTLEALHEREERYRLVAGATNDAIWDWDLLKNEILWNEAVSTLFKYPQTAVDPAVAWWEERLHPNDRSRVTESLEKALNDPSCRVWTEEYRFRCADGSFAHVLDRGSILRRAGRPIRAVGSMLDLTPIREAQDELRQANAALHRSNQELQRFAFNVSHDLQAPLRTISVFSQLLTREYAQALGESGQELTALIAQSVERMSRLVSDLLEFSSAAHEVDSPEPVDCNQALDWALSNLRKDIEDSGARITRGPLPTVLAGRRLPSLLQNLVQNAIKYRSECPLEIHITSARQGNRWVISVRDNGIGFEMEHAQRIFGVFQRLHSHDRYPGSGMGLAICQTIVQQYGGCIWATATPGQGATFHFSLPPA